MMCQPVRIGVAAIAVCPAANSTVPGGHHRPHMLAPRHDHVAIMKAAINKSRRKAGRQNTQWAFVVAKDELLGGDIEHLRDLTEILTVENHFDAVFGGPAAASISPSRSITSPRRRSKIRARSRAQQHGHQPRRDFLNSLRRIGIEQPGEPDGSPVGLVGQSVGKPNKQRAVAKRHQGWSS